MKEELKLRSITSIMNDMLKAVRDYYDSEYAYYIEKDEDEILTIYEWCAENVSWQRERLKMLSVEELPIWMKEEITDTTADSYSVFEQLEDGVTAILAVVNVHRGGCEIAMMKALLPYIPQSIMLQKIQKQQEYLSYHDNLTGLLNRNSFVGYINDSSKKELKSLGALSADINGLKDFNKEFGREYGDEVVIRVGELLEEYFRGSQVFRMTGDEYLAIMENISYDDFLKCVHQLRKKLDHISLGLVSIGYAWEKINIDITTLVSNAENMMHKEKKKYYKNLKKGHHEPVIKKDLLEDIENRNFIVCLVPIMDIDTEEMICAESVVRYQHKDLGILNPERYITLVEETGLSHYLDLYVFEEVCKILSKWESEGRTMVPISVNFSASTLREEDIARTMLGIVEKYHISCEYLQVEVKESGDNMNQEMLAETSHKIRKANIRVILDHFGVKDSTISVLAIMELDGLKLEESLVTNMVGNSRSRMVAKAIIDICMRLGVPVYADGVETRDQVNVLKELGCNYIQGPLFNKPIKAETFEVRYMENL